MLLLLLFFRLTNIHHAIISLSLHVCGVEKIIFAFSSRAKLNQPHNGPLTITLLLRFKHTHTHTRTCEHVNRNTHIHTHGVHYRTLNNKQQSLDASLPLFLDLANDTLKSSRCRFSKIRSHSHLLCGTLFFPALQAPATLRCKFIGKWVPALVVWLRDAANA